MMHLGLASAPVIGLVQMARYKIVQNETLISF